MWLEKYLVEAAFPLQCFELEKIEMKLVSGSIPLFETFLIPVLE